MNPRRQTALFGLAIAFACSLLGAVYTFRRSFEENEDFNLKVAIGCALFCVLSAVTGVVEWLSADD